MHHVYTIIFLSIFCHCLACQDPPLEPPKNSQGTSVINTAGQLFDQSGTEMFGGDSTTLAGEEVMAGDEPMSAGSEVIGGSPLPELDMTPMPESDMTPLPEPDMAPPPEPDMAPPPELDMTPPIEIPESCNGPLDFPTPNCRPDPLPSTGDLYEDCVRRINQLRTECQCLPPLERWPEGESCADQQAEYDAMTNQAHSGFRAGICSPSGRGQNECPGYQSNQQVISLCLQQMWDEGPGEPFIEHGHYINMTNPSHNRVACGFFTTEQGQVWAIQNFSQ